MTKKTLQVALYARVSTDTGKQDPEMQLSNLREYAERRGLKIYHEYVDHMSGTRDDRPMYQKLIQDARQRAFDVVLVWKFDRFARSTRALILGLEEFRELGIDFISYTEQVDTSSAMGKVMFTIISALAEFERSLIQERVVAGLKSARERGVQLGRPRVGFDIGRALELKEQGLGIRRIAKQLGVSHTTVHRYMKAVEDAGE